jgi:hypothetical protein
MGEVARAAGNRQPRRYPRISISKLAEYMSASASRRRSIIRDQREPPEVKTLHCRHARTAVASYLISHDPEVLHRMIEALRRQNAQTSWQEREVPLNITALQRALKLSLPDFSNVKIERSSQERTAMPIGGVRVVVRPDLLLRDRADGRVVGAVNLYFVKSVPLTDAAAGFVTTVLRQFVELAYQTEPQRQRCIFVDVFAGKIHTVPTAFKQRMKDLEAACEEIAGRWHNA